MAFNTRDQNLADEIAKDGGHAHMRKAVAYLKQHRIAPNGNIIVTKPDEGCIGDWCQCKQNPSRALKQRVDENRDPRNRLELTHAEKVLLEKTDDIYINLLPTL